MLRGEDCVEIRKTDILYILPANIVTDMLLTDIYNSCVGKIATSVKTSRGAVIVCCVEERTLQVLETARLPALEVED